MCAICGGTKWDNIAKQIYKRAKNRGRDDHGLQILEDSTWIGNHRATPTTEVENPIEKQPVGRGPWFVFNGIIANDNQLGIKDGEADTSVLPRFIKGVSLCEFMSDINNHIVGSFAIARMDINGDLHLACNYKPIWISNFDGEIYFSSLKEHFLPGMNPYKMRPYSGLNLRTGLNLDFPRVQPNKALIIASAGLDSTAVAAYACHKHGSENVTLLHYQYGCIASTRERRLIPRIAERLACSFEVLTIPNIFFGTSSSLMKDEKDATIAAGKAGAEYAHEWVPARNLVMLSLTTAYAEANRYGHIYLGTNLEEGGAYPDNEEQFIRDFNDTLYAAVQNGYKVEVHTPVGHLMKHEIVPFGVKYNAPFELTWSCYRAEEKHCGNCGPCFMRKTAFERNGLKDPVFKY